MKSIYLLRHAQAMPSQGGSDIDRALSPKGEADAAALGMYMAKKGYIPGLALCSAAKRTQQTLEQLSSTIGQPLNTEISNHIYDASRSALLETLKSVDDKHESALLIAHNPGIYELAAQLSIQGSDACISRLGQGYPPASFTVIECATTNWAAVNAEICNIIDLVNPVDYNAPSTPARWT